MVSPRIRAFIQGVVYLPHFFSWVLIISLFQQMIGGAGLLAQTLRDHGLHGVDMMTNPDTFIVLITAESVWKEAGWGMIVFLAALSSIDTPSTRRRRPTGPAGGADCGTSPCPVCVRSSCCC